MKSYQINRCNLTGNLQTDDIFTLTDHLRPLLKTSLFSTSPKGSPTQLAVKQLSPELSIIWGSHSHLAGFIQSQKNLYIEIPIDEYQISVNGQQISDTEFPLHLIFTHQDSLTYFSLKKKMKSIRLSIDPHHFSSLYKEITGKDFHAHLHSSFLKFKHIDQKKLLLEKIRPFTQEFPPSSALDSHTLADDILITLIKSISTNPVIPARSYCNTLACRAHEIILKSSYKKISITDISKKLNASSRSLQQGFTAVYGVGFIEFHKLYRLQKLREHIQMNGIKPGGLTELMGMFGFTHAGRFSQEYKKAFGILPSKEEKAILERSLFL